MKKMLELYKANQWVKQIADQSAHLFGGAFVVWLIASVTGNLWAGVVSVAVVWIVREKEQYPSARKWDPPLDWSFQLAGLFLGARWFL